jgi:hypothetical protein
MSPKRHIPCRAVSKHGYSAFTLSSKDLRGSGSGRRAAEPPDASFPQGQCPSEPRLSVSARFDGTQAGFSKILNRILRRDKIPMHCGFEASPPLTVDEELAVAGIRRRFVAQETPGVAEGAIATRALKVYLTAAKRAMKCK